MKLTKTMEITLQDAISPGCSVFHHHFGTLRALEKRKLIQLPEVINEATKNKLVKVTELGRAYEFQHLQKIHPLK